MGSMAQLPDEMFTLIKAATSGIGPRLGRLSVSGRRTIETPHYLGLTSRGVVPHLSQDTFARESSISGVYVPLEDFIERAPQKVPPIYQFRPPDGSSPLRRFIALPEETLLVLGARRTPPVIAPTANPNTNTTVSICTSVGFRQLKAEDYAEAAEKLQADVVVGLGDIPYGRVLGSKRIEKATDRQIEWIQDHVEIRKVENSISISARLFAPLLPVSCANQQFYIDCLTEGVMKDIHGLAFYDLSPLEDLPVALQHLPRLAFTEPSSPHEVLQHVSLGLDILTVPFVTVATDAGIALDFSFPAPGQNATNDAPTALGLDMWLPSHATDLSPLTQDCQCYTCTNHHRAYVQHLLAAKEMLGWVLLQIHNHCILDRFFAGIRQSIADGTYEYDVRKFERAYEPRLPEKSGQGPRIRGYQYKSEGPGEPKKNAAPFTMLDDGKEKNAESTLSNVEADAAELEEHGFAEKEL
ncbi:hypothetical protein LTR37_012188 [Vermiconidia calcicola]|uniref:Uncharacterized protein n=1 Tax=Vermiconidia calcicola TaxID=1690605 RepID=A0ACC3N0K6_9PEZI|nr:hypothetical protein LTR37_012188 [Vermiconidia calcicola]